MLFYDNSSRGDTVPFRQTDKHTGSFRNFANVPEKTVFKKGDTVRMDTKAEDYKKVN